MSSKDDFTRGLHELGAACFAYLQPDGGWGWSNAGLIVGDGQSLLVDTLFDLSLTARMLDSMAQHTVSAPVDSLLNTHANGDHCYGNSEVSKRWADVEIVASSATAMRWPRCRPRCSLPSTKHLVKLGNCSGASSVISNSTASRLSHLRERLTVDSSSMSAGGRSS